MGFAALYPSYDTIAHAGGPHSVGWVERSETHHSGQCVQFSIRP